MRLDCCLNLVIALVFAQAAGFAAEPRERSWFEQVERDRDRGAGRVVDDATWETQRLQERHDVDLGRVRPRLRFDRFDEERERELQLQARAAQRQATRGLGASAADQSAILSRRPLSADGAGFSPMAAVAAQDQRDLAEAKKTLERSLRAVDAAEARELRLLRRRLDREGKPEEYEAERQPVQERFRQLRESHRQAFEQVRMRITGKGAPSPEEQPQ